jgi:hypothetical protein
LFGDGDARRTRLRRVSMARLLELNVRVRGRRHGSGSGLGSPQQEASSGSVGNGTKDANTDKGRLSVGNDKSDGSGASRDALEGESTGRRRFSEGGGAGGVNECGVSDSS